MRERTENTAGRSLRLHLCNVSRVLETTPLIGIRAEDIAQSS